MNKIFVLSGVRERLRWLQEPFPQISAGEGAFGGVDQDQETSRGLGEWISCLGWLGLQLKQGKKPNEFIILIGLGAYNCL